MFLHFPTRRKLPSLCWNCTFWVPRLFIQKFRGKEKIFFVTRSINNDIFSSVLIEWWLEVKVREIGYFFFNEKYSSRWVVSFKKKMKIDRTVLEKIAFWNARRVYNRRAESRAASENRRVTVRAARPWAEPRLSPRTLSSEQAADIRQYKILIVESFRSTYNLL